MPSCISWLLIRARELIILMTSDSEDISRLNTPTGSFASSATCSTMFIASEVLPIDGRAATTIISPGCRPVVILSRSVKPVSTPVVEPLFLNSSSIFATASRTCSEILGMSTTL